MQIETNVNFFSIILTNENAEHSFLYILKLYEQYDKVKLPISICLASKINDTDAFKNLLNEAYLIITSELSNQAKKIELLNYLMFIQNISTAPFHSLLTLKMHYMNVDFYFSSKREIPTNGNDSNMNILFSVLDVGKIIKLWSCILQEKQIIVYGNKPFLLYAVIDAITKLIFPLKWPHTLVPCLPYNKQYLIENPTPYIYGVLSSYISIEQLKKMIDERKNKCVMVRRKSESNIDDYKENPRKGREDDDFDIGEKCLVDLETGHVKCNVARLPREEEIMIRKQIQFVKNPELFEKNELFKSEKEKIKANDKVINPNLAFSCNIQRIFFNLLQPILSQSSTYTIGNKIDFKRVDCLFPNNNIYQSLFWKKILKSQLIDMYLCNYPDGKKDDSYKQIFNELAIPKNINEPKNITNSFKLEISCPSPNKKSIMQLIHDMKVTDYSELENALNDYINESQKVEEHPNQQTSCKSIKRVRAVSNESSELSSGKEDSFYISGGNNDNSFKLTFQENEIQSFTKSSTNIIQSLNSHGNNIDLASSNLISSLKESNFVNSLPINTNFTFFDKKIGFISFMDKCISLFDNNKYSLIDVIIGKEFFNEIMNVANKQLECLKVSDSKVLEENEPEEPEVKPSMKMKLSYTSSPILKHKPTVGSCSSLGESFQLLKFHNISSHKAQHLLFFAYYLERLFLEDNCIYESKDKNDLVDNIILLYHKAAVMEFKEFPLYRYAYFLSNLSSDKLNSINKPNNGVPPSLIVVFSEAIENSYKKMRASVGLKKSFAFQNKIFKNSIIDNSKTKYLHLSSCDDIPYLGNSPQARNAKISLTPRVETSNESNKLVDLAKVSKQLKREYKSLNKRDKDPDAKDSVKDSKFRLTNTFTFSNTTKNSPFNNSPKNVSQFTLFPDLLFGISSTFTTPLLINKKKVRHQSAKPLDLIVEIAEFITNLLQEYKTNNIRLDQAAFNSKCRDSLEQLKIKIERLKCVNLDRLKETKEKYTFWVNAFNYLIIYALIYTAFMPKDFEECKQMLKNCQFNIGGYELSLLEIETGILKCYNYLEDDTLIGNDFCIGKFGITEQNILINFALCFPIKSDIFDLKIYTATNFEEQLYQTTKTFLAKNLNFNSEEKSIKISSYIEMIRPDILNISFVLYQNYLSEELFTTLSTQEVAKVERVEVFWAINTN